ncbi:cytochrome c oxidase assembly protein [Variovorax sp. LG9.2]|uniref:cytochrome c oxidase assembly protein n=1 Tax=Variovorax sp. LG9.2 TaxID=3048626 RepID=UPI002B2352F3|nr:cytochrome c oxidase assembly protein [Variovorax sp. LG9.2]MEB0059697.1 cytochrome c oxidase assembly protein [Variovorax sp. LG9.2]
MINATDVASAQNAALPWEWELEPLICMLLSAVSAIYLVGLARQWHERRLPKNSPMCALSFAAGIAVLVLALLSPLDAWGDQLFCAHMAQHLMLMMVAPPLLIMGRPVVVALWAMPRPLRLRVGAWWQRSPAVRPMVELLSAPLAAWLLVSVALWFWHLPKPYALAFTQPVAHALEHLSFFLTSILFWRVVIGGPLAGRLSIGAIMIFLVTFAMENAMLAAILIFAPQVLYGVHAVAPAWSPWSPIEDQQLAGILMWSVTALVDLLALCLLFVAWLASSDLRTQRA